MRSNETRKAVGRKLRSYVFPLALYLLLSTLCFIMLRSTLISNAYELGWSLASDNASRQEGHHNTYESLLGFIADSLDERHLNGWDDDALVQLGIRYCRRVEETVGDEDLRAYMIHDGVLYGSDGLLMESVPSLMEYGGGLQSAHISPISGEEVITLTASCANAPVTTIFDIALDSIDIMARSQGLPYDTEAILIDEEGQVLAYEGPMAEDPDLGAYGKALLEEASRDDVSWTGRRIEGLDGRKRSVHFSRLANGWWSIVTMPLSVILQDLNRLSIVFSAAFALALVLILIHAVREASTGRRMARARETIDIIARQYYALYRVNWTRGTYEMIKGSDEMRSLISREGPYSTFIEKVALFLDEATMKEFKENFSLENIQRLVKEDVKDFGGDVKRRFADGWKAVSVRLLFDDTSPDGEVILTFRTVEAERQREIGEQLLLKEALEAAKQAEKTKQAFFSNMSHDMRTPLNAVMGLSGLAKLEIDDKEKVLSHLDKISLNASQLLSLVNDILEMSRMEAGRVSMNEEAVDITAVVSASLESCKAMASGSRTTIFKADVSARHVLADGRRLRQIVDNIISNAFKYTEEGGLVQVQVSQHVNSAALDQFVIEVVDNGIGMSSDFQKRLFEPYARESRFMSHEVTGTGLGMPIVAGLVNQMSGRIDVESKLGEGTRVTVTLPLATLEEEEETVEEPGRDPSNIKGLEILLAEDNLINMEIAAAMLTHHGAIVSQAWDGQEAVDLFAASPIGHFDAILLDMKMPKLDGCGAARAIRAMVREDAGKVPIIAVTANAFPEDIAETREAGMDEHVAKPIDYAVLAEVLSRLVKR